MSRHIKLNVREAAERYAFADRSDPFALPRALTHLRNGIGYELTDDGQRKHCYDAQIGEDNKPTSIRRA